MNNSENEVWPPPPTIGIPAPNEGDPYPKGFSLAHAANAPPEIIWYGVFSLIVCAGDIGSTLFGIKHLREAIVPYTGWVGCMPYLFGLFFVGVLIFARDPQPKIRLGLVFPLLIQMISGAISFLTRPANNFHNPYLTVSPYQPVWTMLIPFIWICVLLLMPKIRNAAHRTAN